MMITIKELLANGWKSRRDKDHHLFYYHPDITDLEKPKTFYHSEAIDHTLAEARRVQQIINERK